ncbi:MAG: fibronectin type III domain-containing protein [Acidobacteriota bacterium]
MARKKASRQELPGKLRGMTRRKRQVVVAIAVALSLFAAWSMLAYSGALDSVFKQKGKKSGTVSIASLNSNSPSKEYVYAGGRLVATEEPSSSGNLAPPANLKATADTVGQIATTWDAVATATRYEVWRGNTINGSFTRITQPDTTATFYTDSSVTFNSNSSSVTTYLYKVRALDNNGNTSPFSNLDLATAIIWTEDQIQQGVTTVKAQHLLELRDAVNAVRVAAEKSTVASWQPGLAAQQQIKAVHVTELRTNLDEALGAINPPAQPQYTDPNLTGGGTTNIKKAHVDDLRRRIRHRLAP